MRIGSTQPRKADFRLICATNRSLRGEVKAGRFREDLYYRIAVVAIRLPPLRDRTGDIVPLAMHFLDRYNLKFGKRSGPLTPSAVDMLERCRWEGNVRQLQHCLERAVALHSGGFIDATHLDPWCGNAEELPDDTVPGSEKSLSYQEVRAAFERDYMRRLFESSQGNMSEAARLSGIPRQNLYVRMKRWGFVTEK